jgi:hypothetical protein
MTLGTSSRTGIGRNRRRRKSEYLESSGICMATSYIANGELFRHCRGAAIG